MNNILSEEEASNEISLYALSTAKKQFNDDYIPLYIGISEKKFIFLRIIVTQNQYYESLFPYTEIAPYFLDIFNDIKFIYNWLKTEIKGLKYNEDKKKNKFLLPNSK